MSVHTLQPGHMFECGTHRLHAGALIVSVSHHSSPDRVVGTWLMDGRLHNFYAVHMDDFHVSWSSLTLGQPCSIDCDLVGIDDEDVIVKWVWQSP